MPEYSGGPYWFRTFVRSHLPYFLINLGLAGKGYECEKKREHEWYNQENQKSACFHCEVERNGNLWKKE